MRTLGLGLLRWLVGLFCGLAAAGLLLLPASFVVGTPAPLVTGPPASVPAGATGLASGFALLSMGFGVAFFPAAFTVGTRWPRQVLRRALLGFALEGLLAVVVVGYRLALGTPLIGPAYFDWVRTLSDLSEGIAKQPGLGVAASVVFVVVCLALWVGLRAPGPPAPRSASAPPAVAASKPPAIKPAPVSAPAKAIPDEDADLEKLLQNIEKRRQPPPGPGAGA